MRRWWEGTVMDKTQLPLGDDGEFLVDIGDDLDYSDADEKFAIPEGLIG